MNNEPLQTISTVTDLVRYRSPDGTENGHSFPPTPNKFINNFSPEPVHFKEA